MVDAATASLKDVFLDAPSSGQDHRGEASADIIQAALSQDPLSLCH